MRATSESVPEVTEFQDEVRQHQPPQDAMTPVVPTCSAARPPRPQTKVHRLLHGFSCADAIRRWPEWH
jgi:hypothetical protein